MGKKYKVAVVGCGQRGKEHAIGLSADERCEVVALVDVNLPATAALAEQFGFASAKAYTSHLPMLAELHPDIVVITLWPALHLPVFRDSARAGAKAVMCEKPMAMTWADCLEMAEIARSTRCLLTFCHQRRFARGNRWVREQLANDRFGKVERMDLYSPQNLLDCGTHTVDQAMSFNQESPPKWVLGGIDTRTLTNHFGLQSEAVSVATIVFANGVRANLQTGGPDMDLWGGVRVVGSKGFIEVLWDGQVKRAVVYADPAWTAPAELENKPGEHMIAMVRHVMDCVESGAESEISCQRALPVTGALFGIYESVRKHRRVELPLTGVTDNPFMSMLQSGAFERSGA
jgi:predicted dehydrogenase